MEAYLYISSIKCPYSEQLLCKYSLETLNNISIYVIDVVEQVRQKQEIPANVTTVPFLLDVTNREFVGFEMVSNEIESRLRIINSKSDKQQKKETPEFRDEQDNEFTAFNSDQIGGAMCNGSTTLNAPDLSDFKVTVDFDKELKSLIESRKEFT